MYNLYTYERGSSTNRNCQNDDGRCDDTVVRQSKWFGKVALIYPSDFAFATLGNGNSGRNECLNTSITNWGNTSYSSCGQNNWLLLNNSGSKFSLSPYSGSGTSYQAGIVFKYAGSGNYGNSGIDATINSRAIYPSLYLKSTIKITGGDGSSNKPYTLG